MNRDRFPLPLDLRNLSDGSKEHWVTLAHFAYRDDDGVIYVVPSGFRNDLASVPRAFWPAIDPANDVGPAALVHDWLYASRGLVRPGEPRISRAKADAVFCRALRANGVGYLRAQTMWAAVRVGGAKAWRTGDDASYLFHSHVLPAVVQMIEETETPGPEKMDRP